jgi:hypothetical protein
MARGIERRRLAQKALGAVIRHVTSVNQHLAQIFSKHFHPHDRGICRSGIQALIEEAVKPELTLPKLSYAPLREIEPKIDEIVGHILFKLRQPRLIGRNRDQVGDGLAETETAAIRADLEKDIGIALMPLKVKPRNVVVPRVAHGPNDRETPVLLWNLAIGQVIANPTGGRNAMRKQCVDEGAAALMEMEEYQPIGRDHHRALALHSRRIHDR